jgi:hypothetical protein
MVTLEPAPSNQTSSFEDQGHWSIADDNPYDDNWQQDATSVTTPVPPWNSDVESDPEEEEELVPPSVSGSDAATGPRIETYLSAGEPIERLVSSNVPIEDRNPWSPFRSAHDFKLARWFIENATPKTGIDKFFNMGLAASDGSFSSGHTLRKLISKMDIDIGENSWSTQEMEFCGSTETLYYRNPVQIISYLLRQRAYVNDLVYAPIREFNTDGERVYSEMHTAEWWWETQVKLFHLC